VEAGDIHTEDEQFRPLNLEGVLLEIRAFDTSFFEIYSEDGNLIQALATRFNKKHSTTNKFDYGEAVRISSSAPEKYHPSETGFVVGMVHIDAEEATAAYDCVGSDWLYTIELLDGSSLQIPEKYLEPDHKFTWNDPVRVKNTAPRNFRPGEIASVCGMTKVTTQKLADKYKSSIGEWVYTIEYIGGSDTEIPEGYLEKYENIK
jgi:hypothetical protein